MNDNLTRRFVGWALLIFYIVAMEATAAMSVLFYPS